MGCVMRKTHPNPDPHEQIDIPGAEGTAVRLPKPSLLAALDAIDQMKIHLSFVEARLVGLEQALRKAQQ